MLDSAAPSCCLLTRSLSLLLKLALSPPAARSLSLSLPKHKISPGVSFKVCLVKCESIQELEGETSADTYALYAAPVGMGNHFESRAFVHLGQMHTILSRVEQHFILLFFFTLLSDPWQQLNSVEVVTTRLSPRRGTFIPPVTGTMSLDPNLAPKMFL